MNQTMSNSQPSSGPDQQESPETLLKESIKQFLSQHRKGVSDFSDFDAIFSRLLQDLPDPPLEIVWFYSAVRFYSSKLAFRDPLKHAISFFQLLVSCSDSYGSAKRIALLSPVVYQLSRLAFRRKEAMTDIVGLLESIISYISIYSAEVSKLGDGSMVLSSCFVDLARVWVADEVMENGPAEDCLGIFLQFVSDEVCKGIGSGLRVESFAGIVTSQVFLLRLCLKFGLGLTRSELEKDLKDCIIHMVTGFRSYHFVDIILRMLLLEPVLPVAPLLGPEDEILLRDVLTDMVIKMENPFLNPEKGISQPCTRWKNLAIMWLFVVDDAIHSFRRTKDQGKINPLMKIFSKSCLASHLISWVICQESVNDTRIPRNSTPVDFIEWLLALEDRGLSVFDSDIFKNYAKNAIQRSRKEYEDVEMADSLHNVATSSFSVLTNRTRKRRENMNSEGQASVKLIKHIHGIYVSKKFPPLVRHDGLNCGTEVDVADMEL